MRVARKGAQVQIVDAHHHVWCPETGDIGYGWLKDIGAPKPFGDPTPIQRDYLFPEYLAEGDIAASVHVQTDGALPDPVAETRWVAREAEAAGHSVAIVGLADLAAPDLADTLARHAETPHFVGLRQIVARLPDRPEISFAPRDLLGDPAWVAGLRTVAGASLSFDLQLYPEQAEAALAALPDGLAVIVDHAASPRDGDTGAWRAAVSALAARPRTYMKLGGWGMYDAAWSADSIAPMVAHILDAFGSERVMFGSNYPVEKLARPFADVVADTVEAVTRAGGDVEAVMGGTARAVYRI